MDGALENGGQRHEHLTTSTMATSHWRPTTPPPSSPPSSQSSNHPPTPPPCAPLYTLSHACLGACRNGGYEPIHRLDANSLALRLVHDGQTDGLANFLRASCTIIFAGDSVSHDTFIAAFAGALRLRLRLERCEWPEPTRKRAHAPPPHGSLCTTSNGTSSSAVFTVPSDERGSCKRLTLYHMQLIDLMRYHSRLLLNGGPCSRGPRACTLLLNEGLWANRPSELTSQLDKHVRPLFMHLAKMPSEPAANHPLARDHTTALCGRVWHRALRRTLWKQRGSSSNDNGVRAGARELQGEVAQQAV